MQQQPRRVYVCRLGASFVNLLTPIHENTRETVPWWLKDYPFRAAIVPRHIPYHKVPGVDHPRGSFKDKARFFFSHMLNDTGIPKEGGASHPYQWAAEKKDKAVWALIKNSAKNCSKYRLNFLNNECSYDDPPTLEWAPEEMFQHFPLPWVNVLHTFTVGTRSSHLILSPVPLHDRFERLREELLYEVPRQSVAP